MQTPVNQQAEPPVRQRVRIRFCKQGDLRLIGHRDLVRAMERLFRRAELPLGMSQGFHPKPRMSFPAALAVGIEGLDEVMEIELTQQVTAEALLRQLTAWSIPGLDFHHVEVLPTVGKARKARVTRMTYQIAVAAERRNEVATRAAELLECRSFPIQRPNGLQSIDLLEFLEALELSKETLSMTLRVTQQANPGPRDVLRALGLVNLERQGACLRRTQVEVRA
ncbi:MAG: DUF2344 domain-containing protein [Pirellulales bacterium]|nr:DUF2344 domain-containing protein [Pirellulales bacterium]